MTDQTTEIRSHKAPPRRRLWPLTIPAAAVVALGAWAGTTLTSHAAPTVTPTATHSPRQTPAPTPSPTAAATTATAAPETVTVTETRTATVTRTTTTTATQASAPQPEPEPTGLKTTTVYLTGYSWWDNDPPGSATIAYPQIHQQAGGAGTYTDPVTLAVGSGGWEPGTIVYLPTLKHYAIVEDLCASCDKGHQGLTWIDVWVGKGASKQAADQVMNALTGVVQVVLNPPAGLAVEEGDIA